MKLNVNRNCANCGAPVKTEICPYCHALTGLDPKNAYMEYPVIDCKEAKLALYHFFVLIAAVGFGYIGFPTFFSLFKTDDLSVVVLGLIITLPFLGVSVFCFYIFFRDTIRSIIVNFFGKEINATVFGYMDDVILVNGFPTQIVKLLVTTNDGPKFILYQLGDSIQPFKINSKIKLKVYKDIFLIVNKKKYYFD